MILFFQGETIRFQETVHRIQYVHSVTLTNLKSNLYYCKFNNFPFIFGNLFCSLPVWPNHLNKINFEYRPNWSQTLWKMHKFTLLGALQGKNGKKLSPIKLTWRLIDQSGHKVLLINSQRFNICYKITVGILSRVLFELWLTDQWLN